MALLPMGASTISACPKCGIKKIVMDSVTKIVSYECGWYKLLNGTEGICSNTTNFELDEKEVFKCTCSIMDLMSVGCKCGQMRREKILGRIDKMVEEENTRLKNV